MIGQFFAWSLLLILVGWSAFPISFRFFGSLADRGYALSKALGLLVWGYVFWLLVSLGILKNTSGSLLLTLGLVCLISALSLSNGRLQMLREWLHGNRMHIIVVEILFLLAFGFWAFMRATNPEISGTEKPMEMAFINAILRSETFPPHDPWLSGYAISYYYFGYVMVAMITKLLATNPGVAFNLAGALWFSLTAVTAFGIGRNLLVAWRDHQKNNGGNPGRLFPSLGGLMTSFFILIVSNVEGFLEMLHARGLFWRQDPAGNWSSPFWSWIDLQELTEPPTQPFSWVPQRAAGIWWWRASRVLQDFDAAGQSKEIIDEFPFFSYYLADLHPHVLAMPFALLAIGVALNLYLGAWRLDGSGSPFLQWLKSWWSGETRSLNEVDIIRWMRQPDFWLGALVFGGLAFLNTWDFPIYVALFGATVCLLAYQADGWHWRIFWLFLRVCITLGIAGVFIYLPFYLGFSSQAGGIIPSIHFFTRGVHLWIMFLPLLVPAIFWSIWRLRSESSFEFKPAMRLAVFIVFGLWLISYLLGMLIGLLPVLGNTMSLAGENSHFLSQLGANASLAGNAFLAVQGSSGLDDLLLDSFVRRLLQPGGWITLLLLMIMIGGFIIGSRKTRLDHPADGTLVTIPRASTHFVLLVFLVGLGLVLAPEYFYLRDQFGWRINTIFKFYFQAWILWSVVAAFALSVIVYSLRSWKAWLSRSIILLVILAGLVYPAFAIADRMGTPLDRLTLDGTEHLSRYNPDEMAAINWLRIAPLGVIVEAVGGSYTSYGRFSTHSGQPTVLGWPGHESQWRGGSREIGSREGDVERLYRTRDWQEAQGLLHQYNVTYIIIGSLERSRYRADESLFSQHLPEVFRQGEVVIYQYDGELGEE